jgi:predicted metalloprotease with PDZ domain/pimeloyl-ACP methyl ester carboxylesterase
VAYPGGVASRFETLFAVDHIEACAEMLAGRAELDQYTSNAAMDDLDDLRRWLDYESLNIYAGSYGTKEAQVFLRRHPQAVRTLLLNAASPVFKKSYLAHARFLHAALARLVDECLTDEQCRADYPDLQGDLDSVLAKAAVDPPTVVAGDTEVSFGTSALGYALRGLLYRRGSDLPELIHRAAVGDWQPLADYYLQRQAWVARSGGSTGYHLSVVCAENVAFLSDDEVRRETADTFLGDHLIGAYRDACRAWPHAVLERPFLDPVEIDVPTLILSGERDPVTPPENGEALVAMAARSRHVVVPNGGHGALGDCYQAMVEELFESGSIDAIDDSCVEQSQPTRFASPTDGAAASSEPAAGEAQVEYRLSYPESRGPRVTVDVVFDEQPLPRIWVMPRAIPMGYGEQFYDRYVEDLTAADGAGSLLDVERLEGPRWRISGEGKLRRLRYEVDLEAMETEILQASDSSKVRPGYLGVLGYSVFGYLEGLESRPLSLTVEATPGWPVFSTLAPASPPPSGGLQARAADFYALADSQIALGPELSVERVESGVPLFLAVYAETPVSRSRVGSLTAEAMAAVAAYFGSVPFSHYSVLMEVLEPRSPAHEYGFSMEHMDSSTIFFDVERALTDDSPEAVLDRHRYNLAHHIAHSWLPKRCHGEGYFPFSWELAPLLDSIWFSEGFAQYAAAVALAEAHGDPELVDRVLEQRFRASLEETPPFLRRLSTVDVSLVASTRYGTDFRTGRESFSRGGLMAAEMDDEIRAHSDGERDLRDALGHLCQWSSDGRRGFTLEELPRLLSEGAGVDLRAIYSRWMAGRSPRTTTP